MLFAAGFGTRMQHLTADQPKPMIKVAGKPLVDHALVLAQAIRPKVIVANLHYKPHALQDHLTRQGVTTVLETPDILDTGGGLRNAMPALGPGPVFTLNTDAVWFGPNPLKWLLSAWRPERMDALLLCVPLTRAIGRKGQGDFDIGQDGALTRGKSAVYVGAQIISTDRLNSVPNKAFSLNLIWNQMQQNGRLFGLSYPGKWCDVGHPEGIEMAEDMLADQTDV